MCRTSFLRSEFRSEYTRRPSMFRCQRLFLSSVSRSELRSRSSTRSLGLLGEALKARQVPRLALRSAQTLGFFALFLGGIKSATSGRESSANLVSHSSSWTLAAYEVEEPAFGHFDYEGMAWRRRWSHAKSGYEYWFLDHDGCWIGPSLKCPWDLWS